MCKRTDKVSCQHHKMHSEPVLLPQGGAPQPRRSSVARPHCTSGKKSRSHRNEPVEQPPSGHKLPCSPLQERLQQVNHSDSPRQAAKNSSTPRGPSPRGSKRPCQSPQSGLPSASRGMRIASPSKPKGSCSPPVASTPEQDMACVYAGAKFNDPPSPKVLPKPPMHWVVSGIRGRNSSQNACTEMTNILKVMLNVQAWVLIVDGLTVMTKA